MLHRYYLLGAANPEIIRVIRALQRSTSNFQVAGFLDNDSRKHGTKFFGYDVLGSCELVSELADERTFFVNLITGSTQARFETTRQIKELGGRLGNLIHPSVDLTMVKVGSGVYIQEGVVLQAGVQVGDNSSIHMGALIGHETSIADHVFIAHGVSVSGLCQIGEGSFIGTNSTVLPRMRIGDWSTVGAGSVITRDVMSGSTVAGNPAKLLSRHENT